MKKYQLIDEFRLELYLPSNLSTRAGSAARKDLDGRRFRDRLRRAVRGVVKQFVGLRPVQVRIRT